MTKNDWLRLVLLWAVGLAVLTVVLTQLSYLRNQRDQQVIKEAVRDAMRELAAQPKK